jgi:hypothetical protein
MAALQGEKFSTVFYLSSSDKASWQCNFHMMTIFYIQSIN